MSEKKPVLIICHTAAGQMYLGVLLNRIWYAPVLTKTAEEGVFLAKETAFAMVLYDGDVSEIERRAAITLLRNDQSVKNLPLVVFMTNESMPATELLLLQGCTAVLTKPLDLAIVYGVLGRLTGQPRQTPRVSVKFPVEISESVPDKTLTCINLSEGGLYLRTQKELPEGTLLHLKFSLPRDKSAIELAAQVARTIPLSSQVEAEPGIGLRFVELPEEIRQRIRNFVQWEMTGDLEWNAGI